MNERFSSTRSSIRSRSEVVSKTSDRKKSAAERLEADKMKYVKSEKVRQKRITSVQENEMKSSRRHLKSFCSSTPKRERSTKDEDYQMMKLSQLSKSTSHQKHRTTSNKSSNENQAIFSRPKFLSYKNQAAIETRKTSIKTANCPGSRKSISERLEEILTPLEDAKTDAMLMPPPQTSSDPLLETPTEINTLIPSNFSTARSSSDSNEDQKMSTDLRTSSKLTPLLRKEVAPSTFNPLSGCHHEKIKSSKDHLEDQKMINTLNSQTTSSSASNEANKPLTAMTASDLKPKKDKRNPPDCHLVSKNRSSATSSSYQSNLWSPHNHQRSLDRSESSKLNNFFATMGGFLPSQSSNENLSFVANDFSDSNFSYAGASEYVRDDDEVEVKEVYATPSVSIIEKRARIMRWIVSCRSYFDQASSSSIPYYLPPKESSV